MLRLRQVDKLVALSVLGAVTMTWILLTGLDAFRAFSVAAAGIGKGDTGLGVVLVQVLLTIPRRSYEAFANAALIGSLLGLGTLAASGELTALRAAGMSKLRICLSAGLSLSVYTLGVAAIGETLGPAGEQWARAYAMQAQSQDIKLAKDWGLWARDGDTVINAKQGSMTETATGRVVDLADVRVFDFKEKGQLRSIAIAKRARHQAGRWEMMDVRRTEFTDEGAKSTTEATAQWVSGLDPRQLALSIVRPEYLSVSDLRRIIKYRKRNNQDLQAFQAAYWTRLFWPVNVMILVICVLPFAFGTLRSGGLGKRIFLGIVAAVTWYFLRSGVVSLGAVYGMNLALANLLPGLIVLAAAWYYFRRAP
ncbi:LPS export ABC transporter permease LptG [Tahibacter amnicola]|uniref:LPS export ABC transporter permease LptG n=1 Tax=Tahibacter amnicola TaxID=2976241 RepID=A0ABY6BED7_9GAMM|nr:LPS export ABC transporter permease LptG [Tahibacter amnicola]UXI67912.1 LPS export ABC transporter permease LptG [Tahibacter amnicola]